MTMKVEVQNIKPSCAIVKASFRVEMAIGLVIKTIADGGYEFDSQFWAAKSQDWWCIQLGISSATLRRIIGEPPFVRNWAMVDGRRITLLRVGEKGPPTARDVALHLRNIWRKRMERKETPTLCLGQQIGTE